MSNNTTKIIYKPFSFTTLLGLAFIVLKLCKVITWSWWWVTLPLWGVWGVLLLLIALYLIGVWIFHE
jgi:hypothetical protein